jgi:hypothetical protein
MISLQMLSAFVLGGILGVAFSGPIKGLFQKK